MQVGNYNEEIPNLFHPYLLVFEMDKQENEGRSVDAASLNTRMFLSLRVGVIIHFTSARLCYILFTCLTKTIEVTGLVTKLWIIQNLSPNKEDICDNLLNYEKDG
jgi:hypothetical protein